MRNDDVLRSMPADMKFFVYHTATLAYSPETGMCWRVDSRDNSWNLVTPGTATGGYTKLWVRTKMVKFHRVIAEVFLNAGKPLTTEQEVDHKEPVDGTHWQDRLDNLRICSHSENLQNRKPRLSSTSGFKGIHWNTREGKWQASIGVLGKKQHLGVFTTPEAAASAYDTAALQHFGDFALTNEKLGNFNRVKNA